MIEALLIATYIAVFGSSMGYYQETLATKEKRKKFLQLDVLLPTKTPTFIPMQEVH